MRIYRFDKRYITVSLVILLAQGLSATSYAAEPVHVIASQFANEISRERYEEADQPPIPSIFRWDFSKEAVFTYTYGQEVQSKMDFGDTFDGRSSDTGQELSVNGLLLIRSKGDNTADLVLKDIQMSMKMNIGKNEPNTMEQKQPPFVVQGMKEDGSGSFGNSSQDMLLKMLFPLPSKPLKVGEFVDVPSQLPFNAMGSILQVTGYSRIILTRYVKIGKATCAQFDVQTDVSELKIPPELEGEYKCSTKGLSVFFFDVANRSFVSGKIALIMQMNIDAPMPQMKISGKDALDLPKRSKISMNSDNLIRVKLKE